MPLCWAFTLVFGICFTSSLLIWVSSDVIAAPFDLASVLWSCFCNLLDVCKEIWHVDAGFRATFTGPLPNATETVSNTPTTNSSAEESRYVYVWMKMCTNIMQIPQKQEQIRKCTCIRRMQHFELLSLLFRLFLTKLFLMFCDCHIQHAKYRIGRFTKVGQKGCAKLFRRVSQVLSLSSSVSFFLTRDDQRFLTATPSPAYLCGSFADTWDEYTWSTTFIFSRKW